MRGSMSVSIKNFFRSIIYVLVYAILLVLTNVYLVRLSNTMNSLAEFHLSTLKLGIVGYIVFCLLGYEYVRLPKSCDLKEIIDSIPESNLKLFISQNAVLLMLLLLWSGNVASWIAVMYFRFQAMYPAFFINASLSILIDLFFPGVIAVLLGSFLALTVKREVAYCIIIISALLSSPVPSKIFADEAILGYPILAILDFFAILAPNTDWVADAGYGVSIEPYRWFLAAFWFFFLLAIITCITEQKKSKKVRIVAIIMAVCSVVCCGRFIDRNNDCIIQKDYRPNGVLKSDYNYYKNTPQLETQPASFSVEKYCINLKIRKNTQADVVIDLEENTLNEYPFTLHHGYSIERIEDENHNTLEFDRNGDHVIVYAPQGTQQLHFIYAGNTGKYYANYQGIALPGYIAYYPLPGLLSLWDYTEMCMTANTNQESVYYEVNVDTPLTVASNLPTDDNHKFYGTTTAVSLYGGMLEPVEINTVTYWNSPISSRSVDLSGYQESWKKLASQVGETSEFDLTGKSIFLQPVTIMSANANQEEYVEFEDHIITANWSIKAEDICKQHLMSRIPKKETTKLLYDVFSNYLVFGASEETSEVSWPSIEILTKYKSADEISDTDEWTNYINATNSFGELFQYKVHVLGEDYVLKSVYQYLLNPDGNEVRYLYSLGE